VVIVCTIIPKRFAALTRLSAREAKPPSVAVGTLVLFMTIPNNCAVAEKSSPDQPHHPIAVEQKLIPQALNPAAVIKYTQDQLTCVAGLLLLKRHHQATLPVVTLHHITQAPRPAVVLQFTTNHLRHALILKSRTTKMI